MAHSLFGRPGNNPYCHYRTLELKKRGLRERVVKVAEAKQTPFATGKFALVVESAAGGEVIATSLPPPKLLALTPPPTQPATAKADVPAQLDICRSCDCYVRSNEVTCPHCGAALQKARERYAEEARRRQAAKETIIRLLAMSEKEDS
jgi:hypothetical protein